MNVCNPEMPRNNNKQKINKRMPTRIGQWYDILGLGLEPGLLEIEALPEVVGMVAFADDLLIVVEASVWPLDLEVRKMASGYWLKKGKLGKVIELTTNSISIKDGMRETLLGEWQADWEESTTGRRTCQLFPNVQERLIMKHLQHPQGLVHYITGHGPYRESLFRMNLSETSLCCCGGEVTPEQMTLECIFTERERAKLLMPMQANALFDILRDVNRCSYLNEIADRVSKAERDRHKDELYCYFYFLRDEFRFSNTNERILLFIGTLAGMGMGLATPANMLLFGDLTGAMIDFGSEIISSMRQSQSVYSEAFNSTENITDINAIFLSAIKTFAIGNAAIGAATFIFGYISIAIFNYVVQKQIYRIRSLFLKSALYQDIGWYDLNQTGDFASRMADDLNKLEDGIGEKVVMFANYITAFFASLILAFVKGWELTLICLTSLPVTMFAMGLISWELNYLLQGCGVEDCTSRLAKKELDAYGKAGTIADEVLSSMRTVVAFGGEDKEVERYKSNLVFAKNINIKRGFYNGLGFGLLWFFIYASYALAFWYGVGLVLDERNLPADEQIYTAAVMVTVSKIKLLPI
uniref:(California timema) hypothetical protein n=1 Tax=Timema californicum TaxID=61474 RepID=A0A7R9P6B1_TIMCA|nr:unnamed protein product [Timema californicum]